MKTYLLRNSNTVEPQNLEPNPRPTAQRPPLALPAPGPVLFIGLDVHNDTIAVSLVLRRAGSTPDGKDASASACYDVTSGAMTSHDNTDDPHAPRPFPILW